MNLKHELDLSDPIVGLLTYSKQHNIFVNQSISPRRVEGQGLGIFATKPIKKGERIVQIPTKSIFTTSKIPGPFLSSTARESIPVHAQLAAFFAFGNAKDHEPYQAWLKTWPSLDDFIATLPAFWGEGLEQALERAKVNSNESSTEHTDKKQKTRHDKCRDDYKDEPPVSYLPPMMTGWPRDLDTSSRPPSDRPAPHLYAEHHLPSMLTKLASHIKSLPIDLRPSEPTDLARFLHAWSNVNTRCFYYHPPFSRSAPPKDPNEAMVLCPTIDLFNHTSSTEACRVRYTMRGFEVTTRKKYAADEEIHVCYGAHEDEALWAEYGFMLGPGNRFDRIAIGDVVEEIYPLEKDESETRLVSNQDDGPDDESSEQGYHILQTPSPTNPELTTWSVSPATKHRILRSILTSAHYNAFTSLESPELKLGFLATLPQPLFMASAHTNGEAQHPCLILLQSLQRRAQATLSSLRQLDTDEERLSIFVTLSLIAPFVHKTRPEQVEVARGRWQMCVNRWETILRVVQGLIEHIEGLDMKRGLEWFSEGT